MAIFCGVDTELGCVNDYRVHIRTISEWWCADRVQKYQMCDLKAFYKLLSSTFIFIF